MSFVILGHVQTNFDFVYLLIPRISEGFKFCEKNKKHILAASLVFLITSLANVIKSFANVIVSPCVRIFISTFVCPVLHVWVHWVMYTISLLLHVIQLTFSDLRKF